MIMQAPERTTNIRLSGSPAMATPSPRLKVWASPRRASSRSSPGFKPAKGSHLFRASTTDCSASCTRSGVEGGERWSLMQRVQRCLHHARGCDWAGGLCVMGAAHHAGRSWVEWGHGVQLLQRLGCVRDDNRRPLGVLGGDILHWPSRDQLVHGLQAQHEHAPSLTWTWFQQITGHGACVPAGEPILGLVPQAWRLLGRGRGGL